MADPTYSNSTLPHRRSTTASWIIPAVLLVAGLAIFAYYRNKQNSPAQNTTPTSYSSSTSTQSVSKPEDLSKATAGTQVSLTNVPISKIVSVRVFTIQSGDQTVYTVLAPNVSLPPNANLASGQQAALTGTLISTNSDQFKTLNLSAAEKAALANQSLVLLVDQVTVVGSNATTNPK